MTTGLHEPATQASTGGFAASKTRWLQLRPIDAWFFRDGRPYNASESNQTDVASLFPPSATTLVGAIRAALARRMGWDGRSDWTNDGRIVGALGSGFEDLGTLSFRGPWLVRQSRTEGSPGTSIEILFPMPLHVLGKLRGKTAEEASRADLESSDDATLLWQPHCLLTPSASAMVSDLGEACLPVPSGVRSSTFGESSLGLKEPSGLWVTQAGLQRILDGRLPELSDLVAVDRLWKHEMRVGLERCEAARTTKEGALYSPRYVRLQPGVSLIMSIAGLPGELQVPELFPLGGEGRLADCKHDQTLAFPDFLKVQHSGSGSSGETFRTSVVLLTPLLPDVENSERGLAAIPLPGQMFFGISGTRVVSACVGKPQTLGGWNSLEHRPLDLRPVLPAGSTWFLEVDNPAAFAQTASNGFGLKTRYGFGQVALGVWPEREHRE